MEGMWFVSGVWTQDGIISFRRAHECMAMHRIFIKRFRSGTDIVMFIYRVNHGISFYTTFRYAFNFSPRHWPFCDYTYIPF